MYPEELKRFIQSKNNYLGGNDLIKATSIQENPQLNHIHYNPFNNQYQMWDCYGNYYEINVIPYEECQKTLVKSL